MKVSTSTERLNELFDSDPRSDSSIAKALGVSRQSICSWRSGVRSPRKPMLIKICEIYNVSIEWLMGFDVDRNATASGKPFFLPDSGKFTKMTSYMSQEDYTNVIKAFERAYQKMKELGVSLDD